MKFNNIHIGVLIAKRVTECKMNTLRICSFFKCTEEEVLKMYNSKSLDTELLLKWSKLLGYDFFRIYTQYLILYVPSSATDKAFREKKSELPEFRKNIYTKQVIDYILELIVTGEKTKTQITEEYNIPKTTLYKWLLKYKK